MPAASDVKTGMQQRIVYGSTAVAMLVLLFLLDIEIARQSQRWEGLVSALFSRGSILPVAFQAYAEECPEPVTPYPWQE